MKGVLQSLPLVGRVFQDIQPEEVWAFWQHMQRHFDTTRVNKRDAFEMQAFAQALDWLGVLDRKRFLSSYTTTLGRRIYTPFDPGVPKAGWDLWSQVVVCVHEHQHVVQSRREGVTFELEYLTDSGERAVYEAEAYRSNLELTYWRTGKTPSARQLASVLKNYGCSATDISVAERYLELSAVSVRAGAVINESTKVALDWLNRNVPHLRAGGA
jgi:hypothetical protein